MQFFNWNVNRTKSQFEIGFWIAEANQLEPTKTLRAQVWLACVTLSTPLSPPHAVQTSMLSRGFCGFCKNDAFFFKKRKKHHEGFAIFVKTTSFFSKSANNSRGFCYFCKNDALFFKKRKKLTRILRFFLKRRVFFQKAQKTHEDFAIFVKKQRFFQKRKKLTRFLRFL